MKKNVGIEFSLPHTMEKGGEGECMVVCAAVATMVICIQSNESVRKDEGVLAGRLQKQATVVPNRNRENRIDSASLEELIHDF